jgi:two-component sensor histidine kinase
MCQKNGGSKLERLAQYQRDSALVERYITDGSKAYAQKSGYEAFTKSMLYFDSAWQLANTTGDSLLIAASIFAKGRVFDAWNHEPEKTIEHYTKAARYYEKHPASFELSLYLKHLVAHAYDKLKDSTHTVQILTELRELINPMPDSMRQKLLFIPELALISTEVGNYDLAQTILTKYTKPQWIKNDSLTYDYLYHSYITRARLDVFAHKKNASPWLDSLEHVYRNCKNISDSSYYATQLQALFSATTNKNKQALYTTEFKKVDDAMSKDGAILGMQKILGKMEYSAIEREVQLKKEQLKQRAIYNLILALLLAVIGLLLFLTYRKNRQISHQKADLAAKNTALNQKNLQNELLNKELHHRVQNNLQLIMSLVYMQERNSKSTEVKQHLKEIKLRIESISKLHKQLNGQSTNFNLKTYVQSLVSNISHIVEDNRKIITHLSLESMIVPQKIGFPLGLIINEWITNSVKYAQTASTALEIFIQITVKEDQSIQVNYRDNGAPSVPQIEKKDTATLGMSIIALLTEQLGGQLSTATNQPFAYQINIPQFPQDA